MSLHKSQHRGPLFLQGLQPCNLALMGLEKRIAVHIREGWGELEHLVLGHVQSIPQLLKLATRILDKQVEILSLELIQAGQFIVKLVDLSNTTATVGIQERLALRLVNTQLLPQGLNGIL